LEPGGFRIVEWYYAEKDGADVLMPASYHYYIDEDTWEIGDDGPGVFIVKLIIDIINDHRRFVVQKGKGAKSMKRLRKAAEKAESVGYVPAPFYVVRLQDKLVEDVLREKCASRPRILGHRYDRRGHERCYIRRGPLPLDDELRAKLEKTGYRIFTTEYPDAGTNRRMAERGLQLKQYDEWVAILVKWIKHTVCGDESLPYVPAVRVPTKLAG
jgi:hypothetical protein